MGSCLHDCAARPGRKAWPLSMLVLFLLWPSIAAHASQAPAWRRLPALEEVAVTFCLGERSLVWLTKSMPAQRALYTAELYAKCPSGTQRFSVWPCCEADRPWAVIHSRQQLERHLAPLVGNSALPDAGRWLDRYLRIVEAEVDFGKEALVLSSTVFGATGMATASLGFERKNRLLTATIRIRVPPPPLTPDTALFRFAFAVSRSEIERVEIVTVQPAVPDLGITAAPPTRVSFALRE